MNRCVNDPARSVETAQATGMCQTCTGCAEQAKKAEPDRWNLGFFRMGNGITVCSRLGGGGKWPMVAHIRFNREVHLYCHMPGAQLEQIRHMAAATAHIPNGELYNRESTLPIISPQDVIIIKKILNR